MDAAHDNDNVAVEAAHAVDNLAIDEAELAVAAGADNLAVDKAEHAVAGEAGNFVASGADNLAVDEAEHAVAGEAGNVVASGADNVAVDEAEHAVAGEAGNVIAAGAVNVAVEAEHAVAGEVDNADKDIAEEADDDDAFADEHDNALIDEDNDADELDNAVADETGNAGAVEAEIPVAVEAETTVVAGDVVVAEAGSSSEAEANSSYGGFGAGNIFNVQPFKYPVENKSVLWDLEAPILGSFFDKYEQANIDRSTRVSSDVNSFGCFMELINVDLMSILSNEEAFARVKERLEVLQLRKSKYQETMEAMQSAAHDFKKCVQHLESEWHTQRLDRAVVNHLLRMRYISTARNFALERGIQELFDFEPFNEAENIIKALRNKNLAPAKAWCSKKFPWSKLDFHLSCQEYIEYVRTNQKKTAISFAWKFTGPLWGHYKKELLPVLAAVAFGCNTPVLRYKKLFDEERWDFLINSFEQHFNVRSRFTYNASSLCILLESGITALKVPFCFDGEDCKKHDPLQHEYFRTFAKSLPHARHYFPPKLVCHVTKQPLGKLNPPYMLPNGYAYSKEAILGMRNGNVVTCPRTGYVCNFRDVRQLKLEGYL